MVFCDKPHGTDLENPMKIIWYVVYYNVLMCCVHRVLLSRTVLCCVNVVIKLLKTVLYCTALHCTVLYWTLQYCAARCCTVLTVRWCIDCAMLHCSVLCSVVAYCSMLCCVVLKKANLAISTCKLLGGFDVWWSRHQADPPSSVVSVLSTKIPEVRRLGWSSFVSVYICVELVKASIECFLCW